MQVQKRNTLIGAGVGAAAGAVAGIRTGAKKAGEFFAARGIENGTIINSDIFRKQTITDFMKSNNYKAMNIHQKINTRQQIAEGAKDVVEKVIQFGKKTKVKWIAIGVAAGVAAGALIGRLLSKKADKTEKAQ